MEAAGAAGHVELRGRDPASARHQRHTDKTGFIVGFRLWKKEVWKDLWGFGFLDLF